MPLYNPVLQPANNLSDVASASAALATLGGMGLQASTGAAGFALQNATPTILTWTPPNDGNLHRCVVVGELIVSSPATGGMLILALTDPGGTARTPTVLAASQASGFHGVPALLLTCEAGQAVSLEQSTALSSGAATLWAEIWGL